MFPTPNPRNGLNLSPVRQVTILHLVAPNGFFPGVVVTCGGGEGNREVPCWREEREDLCLEKWSLA